jgi:predicted DNA-binding transcriptional regulator YafY
MRATSLEQAKRVNAALALRRRYVERSAAARALMERYEISRRQAYRYLREVERRRSPVAVPERKVVFTVKLPQRLALRIRRFSRLGRMTLSALVTQALERFPRNRRTHV